MARTCLPVLSVVERLALGPTGHMARWPNSIPPPPIPASDRPSNLGHCDHAIAISVSCAYRSAPWPTKLLEVSWCDLRAVVKLQGYGYKRNHQHSDAIVTSSCTVPVSSALLHLASHFAGKQHGEEVEATPQGHENPEKTQRLMGNCVSEPLLIISLAPPIVSHLSGATIHHRLAPQRFTPTGF